MGHRALIASERPDGLYNCHYAHWGALHLRLKHEITPRTPFGGTDVDSQWARNLFEQLIEGAPDADLEGYLSEENPPSTTVDPVPRVRELTLEVIITEQLYFLHHEAFYEMTSEFEITPYLVLWFGLTYHAESVDEAPTKPMGRSGRSGPRRECRIARPTSSGSSRA